MKLLVDGMLGDLAKWLRLLGLDTLYEAELDDKELINLAKKENAILITGDEELSFKAKKEEIKVIFVKHQKKRKELIKEVLSELKISIEELDVGSRCMLCNTLLEKVDEKFASNKLGKVSKEIREFWYCPRCDKVYWYGSHWKNIEKELKGLL